MPRPYETDDTIIALATPPGCSALAIVRLSGLNAFTCALSILRHPLPSDRGALRGRHFLRKLDLGSDISCDAVVICFIAPHSFTGEDIVEFSLPGNMHLVDKLIACLCEAGARPAEPGEFTYRAYLNGKLDLAQAEAVNDSIRAASEEALRLTQVDRLGGFSAQVQQWLTRITSLLARIEAVHDYPGDASETPRGEIAAETDALNDELKEYLDFFARHNKLRSGMRVVIAGPPNVGKSTLFNALLGFDRAITAAEPGTTRDYIEEPVAMGAMSLALVDTAGLRSARDLVEMMGVERTEKMLDEADALILVEEVFHFQPEKPEPAHRLADMQHKAAERRIPCLVVVNKIDTVAEADEKALIEKACTEIEALAISAKNTTGLEHVRSFIVGLAISGDGTVKHLLTERQASLVERAFDSIEKAEEALSAGMALDAVAIDLYDAQRALAGILSADNRDMVLNEVFRRFCLGK